MDLTYYLPEIIFWPYRGGGAHLGSLFVREMFLFSKGKTTCVYCKKNDFQGFP